MTSLVTLRLRLNEAEEAQHRLMLGQQEVEIRDSNGETVKYSAANASRLREYIAMLNAQIQAQIRPPMRGPIRPVWS